MRCVSCVRGRFFLSLAIAAPTALAVILLAGPARAGDGFRCGTGRLVSTGDHMVEVRKKCGDPDFVDQRVEKRKVKVKARRWVVDHEEEVSEEQEVDVVVDEWTYDLGARRFIRFVDFENARVVRVTTGEYGARAEN
jgi:Protein of unknown function (DUF2845)